MAQQPDWASEYFDESRVQRGYCKAYRPINLAHLSPAERQAHRQRLSDASRKSHGLGMIGS